MAKNRNDYKTFPLDDSTPKLDSVSNSLGRVPSTNQGLLGWSVKRDCATWIGTFAVSRMPGSNKASRINRFWLSLSLSLSTKLGLILVYSPMLTHTTSLLTKADQLAASTKIHGIL